MPEEAAASESTLDPMKSEAANDVESSSDVELDTDAAEQSLTDDLETARNDAEKYLDDLRRVAADFDNYRKRAQREMAENVEQASQRVIERLLPVLDSLDLALEHEADTPGEEKLLAGVKSTRQQLLEALDKEGLEVIPALGELFDPTVHEAVLVESSGDQLVVTQEMRRGYQLGSRVLRPAMVAVAEDVRSVEEASPAGDPGPLEDDEDGDG